MRVLILCIAMMVSASVWAQSASSKAAEFTPNPEYEAIIAEAKKLGKAPEDLGLELYRSKKLTFAEARAFNKYYGEKAAKEDEAEIAEIRKEKEKLQKEDLANNREIEAWGAKIHLQDKQLIAALVVIDKKAKINPEDIKYINKIYNEISTYEVIRKEIKQKLGKYIDNAAHEIIKAKILTEDKNKIANFVKSDEKGWIEAYDIEEINFWYNAPTTYPETRAEFEKKLGKYLKPAAK